MVTALEALSPASAVVTQAWMGARLCSVEYAIVDQHARCLDF
ncbi:MAG: hypothetical protein R2856_39880 [Caldilineaceae bacterium]